MKASFYFYKGKIQSLPKGFFFLIILLVIILIPLLISLVVVTATATFFIKKVFRAFIPAKPSKLEYTDFEIIEEKQEKKHLPN